MGKKKVIATALAATAEIYQVELSADRIRAYCNVLEDFEADMVVRALSVWVKTPKKYDRFPFPGDIVGVLSGDLCNVEAEAACAWGLIQSAIIAGDGKRVMDATVDDLRIDTALNAIGGYFVLSNNSDGEATSFKRRDFIRAFVGADERMRRDRATGLNQLPDGGPVLSLVKQTAKKLGDGS